MLKQGEGRGAEGGMLIAHIGVVEGVACSNRGREGGLRAACSYKGGRGDGMLKPEEGRETEGGMLI